MTPARHRPFAAAAPAVSTFGGIYPDRQMFASGYALMLRVLLRFGVEEVA
jgi:hypothetical protein